MGLVIDSFAGGGGASTGIEAALGRCIDVAINHDPMALAMHKANHPGTKHIIDNVWHAKPLDVTGGLPVDVAWFSPDCTHFSKAKGAAPKRDINRAKRSRGLAWVIVRWAVQVRPRIIFMENVEEWRDWAPLLADGRPDPKRKGETRKRFIRQLERLGYKVELRDLRACDYGAPTIRKRLFMIARCDAQPIVWPVATHGVQKNDLFSTPLQPYRTAAEIIDWEQPCPSIFDREARGKKALALATNKRIARGMRRYVINNARPFIVPVSHGGDFRVHSVDEPLRTVTSSSRSTHALVAPYMARVDQSSAAHKNGIHAVEDPLRTVDTGGGGALVTPFLAGCGGRAGQSPERSVEVPTGTTTSKADQCLVTPYLVGCAHGIDHKRGKGDWPLDEPLRTVTGSPDRALVEPRLAAPIITKFRKGNDGSPVTEPLATVTANSFIKRPGGAAPIGLATAFLAKHYGGHEGPGSDLRDPVSTITTQDHNHLVAASLVKLKGTSRDGQAADEPLHTIGAQGTHHAVSAAFLAKYYGEGGQDAGLEDPLHTITSKDRFSLVTTSAGTFPISEEERYAAWWVARFVEDHDNEVPRKIISEPRPAFVCAAGIPIVDIGMRMLTPTELYRAQGFPPTYLIAPVVAQVVRGKMISKPLTKTQQVKMCGNSVCPPLAEALVRANCGWVIEERIAA